MDQEALDRLGDRHLAVDNKGFPPDAVGLAVRDIGKQGWCLRDRELETPLLVLRAAALRQNLERMAAFCAEHEADLAPHGKTTMAPELFRDQLDRGAWAITAATVRQVAVMRAFGVPRVLLANQLVDPPALRWVARQLAADPGFEFLCHVDSVEGVGAMVAALGEVPRPVQVLVEMGVDGGRAGCRSVDQAEAVARTVADAPSLQLAGVEGYEGAIGADRSEATVLAVDRYLEDVRSATERLIGQGLIDGTNPPIVSAGGSVFFDRVVAVMGGAWAKRREVRLVLRSGCYVTHDDGLFADASPLTPGRDSDPLHAAPELWGTVLSRPEPDLAIADFGRRDTGFDAGLPSPQRILDRDGGLRPAAGMTVTALNDQHAYVRVAPGAQLEVGERVACGVSHPCTTLDKWRLIPVVDEADAVVGAVRTFF